MSATIPHVITSSVIRLAGARPLLFNWSATSGVNTASALYPEGQNKSIESIHGSPEKFGSGLAAELGWISDALPLIPETIDEIHDADDDDSEIRATAAPSNDDVFMII